MRRDALTKALLTAAGSVLLVALALALLTPAPAGEPQVGRYQVAAPDLVCDTATGRVVDGRGQQISPAIQPAGQEVGRYQAAGYLVVVTRAATTDAIGRSLVNNELIKAYAVLDTTTGRIVRQGRYYSAPLTPQDLQ